MTFIIGCWRRWLQTMCLLAAACMLIQTDTAGVGAEPECKWVDAWAVSHLPTTINGTLQSVPTFYNQTLRLNMFLKLGGTVLRVKLTNRFSTHPLTIGSAHVALRRLSDGLTSGPDVVAETDHALTFAGAKTPKIEAGKEIWISRKSSGILKIH
jgi:hypothetical protein